ncbi:hypothetical protein ACFL1B_04165 [Nanoarchaeota archaeon]
MLSLYLYLGVYVALLFGISYFISRRQSKESYLIADRNRSSWQILASKFAGAIGAGYFITYTGFAFEYGFGVFAILAGLLIGYLFFAFWAVPKIHKKSKKRKFYTLGHFIFDRTKSRGAMVTADLTSSLVLLAWLIVGIIGGGKIISDFGLLSYNMAVLFSTLVVLVYLLMAGYKAVLITDILQSAVILILMVVVTFGIIGSESITSLFAVDTGTLDIGVLVGFLLFGIFNSFSRADFFQLAYASKNRKQAVQGFAWAILPILIVCFFLFLIGLFMVTQSSGLDSGLVFTEALKQFLPVSLLPIAVVLFFSGIMSSADTNVYGIASHAAMYFKKPKTSMIRLLTVLLLVLIAGFAMLFPDVVGMSIIAGGITLILPLPMIYLLCRKSHKKFISGVVAGFIGMVVGLLVFGVHPTAGLPVFVCSGLGLLYPGKKT